MTYTGKITFHVELAGIPVRIRCRHEENRHFLAAYLTEREPELTVEPTEETIRWIREGFVRMYGEDGPCEEPLTDSFLENNAIHALIAEKLVPRGVLLFHGSALCMDGRAVIFTAPSGTGKSTQARLWRETFGERVRMINDDKPLLRIEENGTVTVCGSPWDGKHHLSSNTSAPLRAVLLVKRSATNRMEPMSPVDAFPILVQQGYLPDDSATRLQVLALERKILAQIPFFTLYCNQEQDAARIAKRTILGETFTPGPHTVGCHCFE